MPSLITIPTLVLALSSHPALLLTEGHCSLVDGQDLCLNACNIGAEPLTHSLATTKQLVHHLQRQVYMHSAPNEFGLSSNTTAMSSAPYNRTENSSKLPSIPRLRLCSIPKNSLLVNILMCPLDMQTLPADAVHTHSAQGVTFINTLVKSSNKLNIHQRRNDLEITRSINQSKRKTSNANGQTNLGHKHKAPDHNHEATQPMVDLPHTS